MARPPVFPAEEKVRIALRCALELDGIRGLPDNATPCSVNSTTGRRVRPTRGPC
jgi:hypothetical protein